MPAPQPPSPARAQRPGTRRRRVTPNSFSIAFGLAGLAEVWQFATEAINSPQAVPNILDVIAAAALVGILLLYAAQGVGQIRADLCDSVFAPFPSLAPITGMLLGAALSRYAFDAGRVIVVVCLIVTILLGGWLTGQWIAGPMDRDHMHPGYFLPTVAGGLIGGATAAEVGLHGVAEASFGVGIVCWVLLGSIVLNRLFFIGMLPAPLIPTLAIELAPPAVGGLAYFSITGGRTDFVATALAGYAVIMALVQLRFIPIYRKLSFAPGFWAFAFSYAAAFSDAIAWMHLKHAPGTKALTIVILVMVTAFIGAIAVRTVPLLVKGKLFPPMPQTGP